MVVNRLKSTIEISKDATDVTFEVLSIFYGIKFQLCLFED